MHFSVYVFRTAILVLLYLGQNSSTPAEWIVWAWIRRMLSQADRWPSCKTAAKRVAKSHRGASMDGFNIPIDWSSEQKWLDTTSTLQGVYARHRHGVGRSLGIQPSRLKCQMVPLHLSAQQVKRVFLQHQEIQWRVELVWHQCERLHDGATM